MSQALWLVTGFSWIALLAISIWKGRGSVKKLSLYVIPLVVVALFLVSAFGFPGSDVVAKGDDGEELYFALVLYVIMVAGMGSQHVYARLERPRRHRPKFDLGTFLAPIFASPLVFIPLVAAFQSADMDLRELTIPRLMVFLVAFENGFFWKELFDRRRDDMASGRTPELQ